MKQVVRIQTGFSLLELMITVAVLSIIAAVGWSVYERYRVKVFRSECVQAMYIAFNDLNKCASHQGNRYLSRTGNFCTITNLARVAGPPDPGVYLSRTNRCIITPTINIGTPDEFILTATYNEDLTSEEALAPDATCGALTLTHENVKGNIPPIGGTATPEYCWGE